LIQDGDARDLEVNGAWGRLILYQGVMLKVELESEEDSAQADERVTA
jgi:hypothetical protein